MLDLEKCTGCGLCAQICPKNAIKLVENREGFKIPQIDNQKCINCGLCKKKCHIYNDVPGHLTQHAYALISNQDRRMSSSGGAFSAFARYVFNRGGVVFGAAFDPFPFVKHICVDKLEDLDRLRGAKYVQSEIGHAYSQTAAFLKSGRPVLFTGTPCQVAALYSYLNGNRYEELLITLDIVCHGVPNQSYFNAYLQKLESSFDTKEYAKICDFKARKLDGWSTSPMVRFQDNPQWIHLFQEKSAYVSAFYKCSIFREGCYKCRYSNMNRVGDFTIADYWGIGKHGAPFKKTIAGGVSLVISNRDNGPDLMKQLTNIAYIEERPLKECLFENHNLSAPTERPQERYTAVSDMLNNNISLKEYAQKYSMLNNSLRNRIDIVLTRLLDVKYIYNLYKNVSYKLK